MKRDARVTNGLLIIGVLTPLLPFWVDMPFNRAITATALFLATGCSALAAIWWSRVLRRLSLPEQPVSPRREAGVQHAMEECFAPLWLVPERCLVRVDVLRWSRNVLRHGATVRTALISSLSAKYFLMSASAWALFTLVARGEWTRELGLMDLNPLVQLALAALLSWIGVLCLFHGLFRWSMLDKLPRSINAPSDQDAPFMGGATIMRWRR